MVYDYIDLDYWDGSYFDDDYDGTDKSCKRYRRISEEVILEGFGEVKNELRSREEVNPVRFIP